MKSKVLRGQRYFASSRIVLYTGAKNRRVPAASRPDTSRPNGGTMSDSWLFFNACGHPFGLLVADAESETERQAWQEFYWTEKERRAAEARGVTCLRVDHATYRAKWFQFMRDGCDCADAGALFGLEETRA